MLGSYGSDTWTAEAQKVIQDAFETICKVFIVPTGTGANILALKLSCLRQSVLCTNISHIQYQESGSALRAHSRNVVSLQLSNDFRISKD